MPTVALIGYPLGHTLSPAMHNTAYKYLGLDYEYVTLEVKAEELARAVDGLRALHFAGFNVTIPHKEAVVDLLDELTGQAQKIGAVNTVKNEEGKLIGYNTDASGFYESLRHDLNFDPKGKITGVLGAGGAGKAVCAALLENGAKSVWLTDIDREKGQALAEYLNDLFEGECKFVDDYSLQGALDDANLLVNATPLGMHPQINGSPLPKGTKLHKKLAVYDVVYNPQETKFIKEAKAQGITQAITGLGMLVRQGALAFSVFTGKPAPLEIMQEAARSAL
jgi:shikimate dehydrogenase